MLSIALHSSEIASSALASAFNLVFSCHHLIPPSPDFRLSSLHCTIVLSDSHLLDLAIFASIVLNTLRPISYRLTAWTLRSLGIAARLSGPLISQPVWMGLAILTTPCRPRVGARVMVPSFFSATVWPDVLLDPLMACYPKWRFVGPKSPTF